MFMMARVYMIVFIAFWATLITSAPLPVREGEVDEIDTSNQANVPIETVFSPRQGFMSQNRFPVLPIRQITTQNGQTAGPLTPQFQGGTDQLEPQQSSGRVIRTSIELADHLRQYFQARSAESGDTYSEVTSNLQGPRISELPSKKTAGVNDGTVQGMHGSRDSMTANYRILGPGYTPSLGPSRYQSRTPLSTSRQVEMEGVSQEPGMRGFTGMGLTRMNSPETNTIFTKSRVSQIIGSDKGNSKPGPHRWSTTGPPMNNLIDERDKRGHEEERMPRGESASAFERLLQEKNPSILEDKIPFGEGSDPYIAGMTQDFQVTPPKPQELRKPFEFAFEETPRIQMPLNAGFLGGGGMGPTASGENSNLPSRLSDAGVLQQSSLRPDRSIRPEELAEILNGIDQDGDVGSDSASDWEGCDITASECGRSDGAYNVPNYQTAGYLRNVGMKDRKVRSTQSRTSNNRRVTNGGNMNL